MNVLFFTNFKDIYTLHLNLYVLLHIIIIIIDIIIVIVIFDCCYYCYYYEYTFWFYSMYIHGYVSNSNEPYVLTKGVFHKHTLPGFI